MLPPEILIQEIESRGAAIRADEGKIKVSNDDALNNDLRAAIRHHKPQLLAILSCGDVYAPQSSSLCSPSSMRVNAWVMLPTNALTPEKAQRNYELALAAEIARASYFHQVKNEWTICWAKGRHAWQRFCLDHGGILDADTGVPSIPACDAVQWANSLTP